MALELLPSFMVKTVAGLLLFFFLWIPNNCWQQTLSLSCSASPNPGSGDNLWIYLIFLLHLVGKCSFSLLTWISSEKYQQSGKVFPAQWEGASQALLPEPDPTPVFSHSPLSSSHSIAGISPWYYRWGRTDEKTHLSLAEREVISAY